MSGDTHAPVIPLFPEKGETQLHKESGEKKEVVLFPMWDLFFKTYDTMLDIQKSALQILPMMGEARKSVSVSQELRIPVLKEELIVEKRQRQRDKALRIRTSIIERPIEATIKLRSETVRVERRPTRKPLPNARFQERIIEIHEMYEEPIIHKVVNQTEELIIRTETIENQAVVREKVRETQVNVENRSEGRMSMAMSGNKPNLLKKKKRRHRH